MELTIRPAEPADLLALCELYRHLNPADALLPKDRKHQVWATMLQRPGFVCLVGIHARQIISSCCLSIIPNLTRGGRPYALIENVMTHQDFRRRGFAKSVLQEALDRASNADCYKIMLLTGSKRPEVHRLYEACGFRSDDKTAFVARPG